MKLSGVLIPLILVALAAPVPGAASETAPVFKIYVEHTGVYEVSFERLDEAGLDRPRTTATIGLRNFGEPVPVWVEDGGDGVFGPGDRLLFMGETLRGEYSYLDPYSRFNCYVLDFSDPAPRIGHERAAEDRPSPPSATLLAHHHLEPDRVMVRFRTRQDEPEEEWYWERLSVADRKPFHQEVILDGLDVVGSRPAAVVTFADALSESLRGIAGGKADSTSRIHAQLDSVFGESTQQPTTVRFRLGLRGWSEPRHRERESRPHHELEIQLNGELVGKAVWDGTEHHIREFEVPSTRFLAGVNELSLVVPKRFYPESGDLVVDVVLLNWIELEYEHVPSVENEQLRLRLADPEADRRVAVTTGGGPVDLYLPGGIRIRGSDGAAAATLEPDVSEFSVLRSDAAARPNDVVLDRPSDLRSDDHQADYIMITHRTLLSGTERLADFHRGRGFSVEVVDVQDIYDEFNFGIVSPMTIKDFLRHAFSEWRAPQPRFVLLVGDASWDFKNTTADDSNYADWTYRPGENRRFWKNRSTAYAEGAELNHRNLVPTSSYLTLEGHAASDTWFVCFDDGDTLPDMAIGRLPVVTPEELEQVIDKTIGYTASPTVGPWRRNLLFITNESVGFQRRSDAIAERFLRRGYIPKKIYPHPSEPANEVHTRRIIEILDEGVFAVQFLGHGGRYIWRTGPPDLAKNHDLFTLDHLDELADSTRLPIVLSLTCYSAPFDHPTADSIGEKLIRLARRGAIAVFAASWRNSPSPIMGESLLDELTTPGNTIGEAVMRAKRLFRSDVLVQTYNLLGDPAVPVGAPAHALELAIERTGDDVSLRVESPVPFGAGTLLAEWLAADGSVLREDRLDVTGTVFDLSLAPGVLEDEERLMGVRVYVWDESSRIDGIGWADSGEEDDPTDQQMGAGEGSETAGDRTGIALEEKAEGGS